LWDDVQAVLAANRVERATGARASNPGLLTGLVFDETGERLTPTYAVKREHAIGTMFRLPSSPAREGPVRAAGGYRLAIWKAW
jgi:hypothetical protein